MHGFAVTCALLVGACSFKADYTGGHYTCTDHRCPTGLDCISGECVEPRDAGSDGGADARPDARPNAQTCADPQPFPGDGGTTEGTTASKPAKVSSMCGGLVFNGPEAVYKITTVAGAHMLVSIDAGQRKAYVLSACQELPSTPTCEGNMFAKAGQPIQLFPNPGTQYIVVDDDLAGASGTFTLTVSFP